MEDPPADEIHEDDVDAVTDEQEHISDNTGPASDEPPVTDAGELDAPPVELRPSSRAQLRVPLDDNGDEFATENADHVSGACLNAGDAIECLSSIGAWAPAEISSSTVDDAGSVAYSVRFPDGASEESVPLARIRRPNDVVASFVQEAITVVEETSIAVVAAPQNEVGAPAAALDTTTAAREIAVERQRLSEAEAARGRADATAVAALLQVQELERRDAERLAREEREAAVQMEAVRLAQQKKDEDEMLAAQRLLAARKAEAEAAAGCALSFDEVNAFHERAATLQAANAAYVAQHPELGQLVQDFVAACLHGRPSDVPAFAADFFARFK